MGCRREVDYVAVVAGTFSAGTLVFDNDRKDSDAGSKICLIDPNRHITVPVKFTVDKKEYKVRCSGQMLGAVRSRA